MAEGDKKPDQPQTGADKTPAPQGSQTGDDKKLVPQESQVGVGFVGPGGILAITVYLVLLATVDFYLMVKVWPPADLGSTSQISSGASSNEQKPNSSAPSDSQKSNTAASDTQKQYWKITLSCCITDETKKTCWISLNTSLFLIAVLAGALGSLLHTLRSIYWYAGNRTLRWSWSVMYILLPFAGAALSLIFYIIVRGGFLPQSTVQNSNPFGFAALGTLVGLFSEQAVLKLRQVAETVFTKAEQGNDGPAPKILSILPVSGPVAGNTLLTITGNNFADHAKVNIGGKPAQSAQVVDKNTIKAVTPDAAAPGKVDVEVVNVDNQKDVLHNGFEYQ